MFDEQFEQAEWRTNRSRDGQDEQEEQDHAEQDTVSNAQENMSIDDSDGLVAPQANTSSKRQDSYQSLSQRNLEDVSPIKLWTSIYLTRLGLGSFIAAFLLLILALTLFYWHSEKYYGFENIPSNYVYKFGPTTVLTFIAAFIGQLEYRAKQLMPWSLMHKRIQPAEKSVTLDYLSPWNVIALYKSAKAKHFMVTIAILVSLASNLLIIFSVSFFSVELRSVVNLSTPFTVLDRFDGAALSSLSFDSRAAQAMIATSVLNASFPVGTTRNHAFQLFNTSQGGLPTNATLSAVVNVFSPGLKCEATNASVSGLPDQFPNVAINVTTKSCVIHGTIDLTRLRSGFTYGTVLFGFCRVPGDVEQSLSLNLQSPSEADRVLFLLGLKRNIYAREFLYNSLTVVVCEPEYTINLGMVHLEENSSGKWKANVSILPTKTPSILANLEPMHLAQAVKDTVKAAISLERGNFQTDQFDSFYQIINTTYSRLIGADFEYLPHGQSYGPSIVSAKPFWEDLDRLMGAIQATWTALAVQVAKNYIVAPADLEVAGIVSFEAWRLSVHPMSYVLMVGTCGIIIILLGLLYFIYAPCEVCPRDPGSVGGFALIMAQSPQFEESCKGLAASDKQQTLDRASKYSFQTLRATQRTSKFSIHIFSNKAPIRVQQDLMMDDIPLLPMPPRGMDAGPLTVPRRPLNSRSVAREHSELPHGGQDENTSRQQCWASWRLKGVIWRRKKVTDGCDEKSLESIASIPRTTWWQPFGFSVCTRFLLLLSPIILIVPLGVLLFYSNRHGGLGDIAPNSNLRYVWTYIPALVMFGVNVIYNMLGCNTKVIQTYHRLYRGCATRAEIMTNDQSGVAVHCLWKAYKFRNWAPVPAIFGMLIVPLLNIALNDLYMPATVSRSVPVKLRPVGLINQSLEIEQPEQNYPLIRTNEVNGGINLTTAAGAMSVLGNVSNAQGTFREYVLPIVELSFPNRSGFSLMKDKPTSTDIIADMGVMRADVNCTFGSTNIPSSPINNGSGSAWLIDLVPNLTRPCEDVIYTGSSYKIFPFSGGFFDIWSSMMLPTDEQAANCPWHLYVYAHVGTDETQGCNITRLHCYPFIEQSVAQVTLSLPDLSVSKVKIDSKQPTNSTTLGRRGRRIIVDNTAWYPYFGFINRGNETENLSTFMQATLFGNRPLNPEDLLGEKNAARLAQAVERTYALWWANSINIVGRYHDSGVPLIDATLETRDNFILKQNKAPTYFLIGLLVILFFVSIGSSAISPRILYKDPSGIMSAGTLLAGSHMLHDNSIPKGAESWTAEEEKEHGLFENRTFTLRWWDGSKGEEKRYGVDVEDHNSDNDSVD